MRWILLLALATAAPVEAETLRCDFTQREQCQPGQACRTVKPATWADVDLAARVYRRCDAKGCDAYPYEAEPSGMWLNINMPGHRGMLARLAGNEAIMEVVTLNAIALVSYGQCKPLK